MAGYVNVTEYSNYGDPSGEMPVEPSSHVTVVPIGGEMELQSDTRIIVFQANLPCRICVSATAEPVHTGWPLPADIEVVRGKRPVSGMRVHVLPES